MGRYQEGSVAQTMPRGDEAHGGEVCVAVDRSDEVEDRVLVRQLARDHA